MIDLKRLDQHLAQYVRPDTFPLAIRMLREGEALPEKVRVPSRDLGLEIATCQGFAMARRYGWALAISREDLSCPLTKMAFGFEELPEYYKEGHLCEGMYTKTCQAGAVTESEVPRFAYGEYRTILVAPLARASFEPHVILVFGNSAQVMLLVIAALYKTGGRIRSSFSGRIDCADEVIETMRTGKPQVILPCYGDRVFGHAQDHEMAFSFPAEMSDDICQGLEGAYKGGIRYPIPMFMRFQPQFPESYRKVEELWKKGPG